MDILTIGVAVDTKDLVRGNRELDNFSRTANTASGSTDKLSSSFMGMSRSFAASIVSVTTLVAVYKKSITEARNFAAEQGQLESVIKSTGMAAGFTALQLNRMADSFAKSTSFSAGEINRAQTRLLSYSGVVGDTFPQAMQITIDMAARMGMSIEQSAETIGRALDIPSQGLSALSRQGFRFTQSQKDLVEQLEATGRVAEAQKIIIDAVTASYGGAAEALNTGLTKATSDAAKAYQDLLTTIGNTSLVQNTTSVVFESLTEYLSDMKRIIESSDWIDKLAFFTLGITTPSMQKSRDFSGSVGGTEARLEREASAAAKAAQATNALAEAESKKLKIKKDEIAKEIERIKAVRAGANDEIKDLKSITALVQQGFDIEEARFRIESERKGLLPAQIEALLTQKNIQDDIAVAEVERQSRLQFFIKTQQKAYDDEVQRVKEIIKLQQEKANENFKQAQDAQKAIEDANQRMAENLNRSLTDALLRGFESGLSFAENFRRTLRNMFATLVLQPIISMVLQPVTNVATGIMSQILGTGTAGASGIGNTASTLGGIGNLFQNANTSIVSGVASFGQALSNFGATGSSFLTNTASSLGSFVQLNQAFIAKAVPFLDAGVKLLSGDVKGAAFSGAGATIGGLIGGGPFNPLGAAVGAFVGNLVGGMFGGKKQPRRTTTELPDVAEVFNQQLSALLQGFGGAGNVTSTASFSGRAGGSGYGGFSGMVEDMAISDGIRYKDAFNDASLQAFITRTLTETLTRAIKSTDIDQAFKDLFDGITDREEMGKTIQAVIQLNQNNQQLTDTLGITATQVALLANESDIAGDNLVALVNTLTGISTELFTTGDALVAIKAGIDGAFLTLSNTQVPANLKAFDEAIKALDKTTAEGRQDFLGLIALRGTFAEFETAMAGLRGNVRGALFNIVTDAERLSMMNEDLTKLFADLSMTVPSSVNELIQLGNSIDLTTAAGINLASVFPTLVNAFNETRTAAETARVALETTARAQLQLIVDAANEANRVAQDNLQNAERNVETARANLMSSFDAERDRLQGVIDNVSSFKDALRQAFDTRASGLQETINKFRTFGQSIRDFRKALGQSLSTNADPLSAARNLFNQTVASALQGDTKALENIVRVSTDYLDTTKQYAGDFVEYQKAFALVSNTLLEVENSAFATASVADLQLGALKTQVGSLISIDENIVSVEQAMQNLKEAQGLATIAQSNLTALNNQQVSLLGVINESVLSVATAIAGFNVALQAQSTAQSAATSAQGQLAQAQQSQSRPDPVLTPESIYEQFLGRKADPEGLAYWKSQFGATVDTNELRIFQEAVRANQALGFEQTDEALVFAQQKFANGASFTNGIVSRPTTFNTGMMGEAGSEAIMPLSNIGGRLGVTSNNSEMVAQLKAISEKITRLEAVQIATAQNTGKVAKIIERADNGDSINVTVTA